MEHVTTPTLRYVKLLYVLIILGTVQPFYMLHLHTNNCVTVW